MIMSKAAYKKVVQNQQLSRFEVESSIKADRINSIEDEQLTNEQKKQT